MSSRYPGYPFALAVLLTLTVGAWESARAEGIVPAVLNRLRDPIPASFEDRIGDGRLIEMPDLDFGPHRETLPNDEPRSDQQADQTDDAPDSESVRRTLLPRPVPLAMPDRVSKRNASPSGASGDVPPPEPDPLPAELPLVDPDSEISTAVPLEPGSPVVAKPLFDDVLSTGRDGYCRRCGRYRRLLGKPSDCRRCECGAWGRLFYLGVHEQSCDSGIGQDRVMLAPFFIETTQPFNNYRARIDDATGLQFPDRAEYFWAAPPKGPKPERAVDYQDLRLQIELGSENFSVATDLPLRVLDPVVNDNTAGFSDMSVTQKAVMVHGDYWQISQFFRTYFNTGSARKGLGTGHISLEPGVLGRYKWNQETYLHGELRYLFPLGADPNYTGGRLRYGLGISTVLYENDMFAAMPTLEFAASHVLDGARTRSDGTIADIDGEGFLNVHPGMRFTLGPRGDLGLFEVGIAGGLGIGNARLYDHILRLEMRWSF